ncbi:MAG: FHA domain-containing protein [Gammaproteobacteria bacterium]|nr:FHA domain-containing protein [Gammaproteobacteria bacterium]
MLFDLWVLNQAFGASADSTATIKLPTQQEAVRYLKSILTDTGAVRVLCGPPLSGKSTIVSAFCEDMPNDLAVAVVDGSGSTGHGLLSRILSQFGYRVDLPSSDELFRMLSVFAVQQARTVQSPIIVVENIEKMQIGALRALSMLATLKFQGNHAIRLVLTGGARAAALLRSRSLATISERVSSTYDIEPLSHKESMLLLHGRLGAGGVVQPDEVLPMDVCDALHEVSGGLPGLLMQNARAVIGQAASLPVSMVDIRRHQELMSEKPKMPRLIVTSNGKTIEEYEFREKKITLGRSNICDIVIYGEYASKFHAMLILYADALILIDLNSSNGTFVNSVRVKSTILRNDDIISVADYRIKVLDAPESGVDVTAEAATADTSKMKTLDEARQEKKDKLVRYLASRKRRTGSAD